MQEMKGHSSIVLCLSPCDQLYFSGKLTCQSVPPKASFMSKQKPPNYVMDLTSQAMVAFHHKYGSLIDSCFFHSAVLDCLHPSLLCLPPPIIPFLCYKPILWVRQAWNNEGFPIQNPQACIFHMLSAQTRFLCTTIEFMPCIVTCPPSLPPSLTHTTSPWLYAQDVVVVEYSNKYRMNEMEYVI